MPSSAIEWGFWIFSTIIVGGLLGIGVNLISPSVGKRGSIWLQSRRLKQQKYVDYLNFLSLSLDDDPSTVFLQFAADLVGHLVYSVLGLAATIVIGGVLGYIGQRGNVYLQLFAGLTIIVTLIVGYVFSYRHFMRFLTSVVRLVDLNRIHTIRKEEERSAQEIAETTS